MAYYKRSKLLPLKLTHHPLKKVVDVHRGVVRCSSDNPRDSRNSFSDSDRLAHPKQLLGL